MNKTSFMGDKPVNRIGFGAMQLAGPGVFGPPRDPDAARAMLRRAIELGVDHIDTAQYYGPDVVNDLIRETLHPYPENLKLVTKVGGRRDDRGAWLPAQTPAELREGVEDNLRSLQVERMDLVNLRLMTAEASGDLLAEQLGALEDLRSEGKLDLIGISEAGTGDVRRALELVDIAEVQNAYSVVNRSGEDVLELCIEREIAFVPYFPLGSAFSGGPSNWRRIRRSPASRSGEGSPPRRWRSRGCSPLRTDAADSRHELGGRTSRRTWPRRTSNSTTRTSPSSRTPPRSAIPWPRARVNRATPASGARLPNAGHPAARQRIASAARVASSAGA